MQSSSARTWQGFFDDTFAGRVLVAPRPGELDFLIEQLQVQPGARLFDQCCGNGRVAVPLAQQGYLVYGVDQTRDYVEQALRLAPSLQLVVGDAGSWRPPQPVDGAFNLYSSFGYSSLDEVNQQLLQCVSDSLREGARFVLDTQNFARVMADFQPAMVTHYDDGLVLVRESELDLEDGMLRQTWTYRFPDGGCKEVRGDCRMYFPRDLARMCGLAGLTPLKWFGSLAGDDLDLASSRLILVAQKVR